MNHVVQITWYLEHGGEQGMVFPTRRPDTLNIVVKLTENFLEAFEKKSQLKI